MNMPLYKKYENTKPIAVLGLSNWGGLEILDIEYGIEDYVIVAFNFGTRQKIRRHKVCIAPSGREYIRKEGTRYYFDTMMEVRA